LSLSFSDDDDELPEDDADVRLTTEERQAVDWPVQALLARSTGATRRRASTDRSEELCSSTTSRTSTPI